MAQAITQQANPFYKGCTALELARLFDIPVATVRDNLVGVIPSGKRGNVDLYPIRAAAQALLPLEADDETVRRILKLNHTSLPKMLAKEFWLAETHRQRFQLTAGELWPTEKVVEWLSDSYKQIRLALMLMADSVDREEALTDKQRQVIIGLVDATLNDAADRLVYEFKNRRDDSSHEAASSQEDDGDQEL